MILKSLSIENFRSYKKESINFPAGATLFEGDAGSGKSSILYAIEFALFGLGDLKGGSLLRKGEKKCSVELVFDVDGKEYKVFRSLAKRGKGIVQDEGYIVSDGRRLDLSVSEMRAKILEILNFKEELQTKSSSVIFRYAIFTPQEEMKEILRLKVEDRLQTLRKAFGIEDYKTAKDNTKYLVDDISSEIRFISGELENFEQLNKDLKENEKKLGEFSIQIKKLEDDRNKLSKVLENAKNELKKLESVKTNIEKLATEIPLLEKEHKEKSKQLKDLQNENEAYDANINSHKEKIAELNKLKSPTEKNEEQIKQEIKELNEKKDSIHDKLAEIKADVKNFKEILDEKKCPICKRPADPKEFSKKISEADAQHIALHDEYNKLKEAVENSEKILDDLRDYDSNQKEAKRLEKEAELWTEKIKQNEKRTIDLAKRISELDEDVPKKKSEIEKNKDVFDKIEQFEKTKRESDENLRDLGEKIGSLKGQIKELDEQNKRLKELIERLSKQEDKKTNLEQHSLWLTDYFTPTIDSIERHVLSKINEEFNSLFQKWFGILMEGTDMNVKVDENFEPIIEQGGYEQNMNIIDLSGGEKTSLALAYRLALNLMVKKVCTSLKSNLLILDEPTDGFSKEQLFKVRDVLNELKCDQIILVSHEKELESFVDKIFRINKIGNISKIEGV
jgi:exonuclease SbcC